MTDLPYTEADLRAEAALQHASLTDDPDFMGVGEQMIGTEIDSLLPPGEADGAEGPHWDDVLDRDQFNEAQDKIHALIAGAADVSEWAVDLGADGLAPDARVLNPAGGVRLHFAFGPEVSFEGRQAWIDGINHAIREGL